MLLTLQGRVHCKTVHLIGFSHHLSYSGIDSAKPTSASTQQAFSFGFPVYNDSGAPKEPETEELANVEDEPLVDSSAPMPAAQAEESEPQQPAAVYQQVCHFRKPCLSRATSYALLGHSISVYSASQSCTCNASSEAVKVTP